MEQGWVKGGQFSLFLYSEQEYQKVFKNVEYCK